jgi:glycosyltransferase involved in cell wall biosynthesis
MSLSITTNQPLISVVIPAFNRSGFIGKAIDSVLAQDYPNIEIIVVDDGSTDDTHAVVGAYGDRVRYLKQPHNRGVSAARNIGVRQSQGDIVSFLDSDDQMLPHRISTEFTFLQQHPQCIAVYAGVKLVYTDTNIAHMGESLISPNTTDTSLNTILIRKCVNICHMVHKEAFLRSGGFDESLQIAEDFSYYISLFAIGPIGSLNTILTHMFHHQGNSIDYLDTNTADRFVAINHMLVEKAVRLGVLSPRTTRLYHAEDYYTRGWIARLQGRYGMATCYAARAILIHPWLLYYKSAYIWLFIRQLLGRLFRLKNSA